MHFLRANIAMLGARMTAGRKGPAATAGRDIPPAPRPIRGGSDDLEVVTNVLAGGAELCADCIAQKTGIPRVEMPLVIARIAKTVRVQTPDTRCAVCLMTRPVYRLA